MAEETFDALARLQEYCRSLEAKNAELERINDNALKMISEDRYAYNRKTNRMIERHAEHIVKLGAEIRELKEEIEVRKDVPLGEWIDARLRMPPQNVPVTMVRRGSEQIPCWEWRE